MPSPGARGNFLHGKLHQGTLWNASKTSSRTTSRRRRLKKPLRRRRGSSRLSLGDSGYLSPGEKKSKGRRHPESLHKTAGNRPRDPTRRPPRTSLYHGGLRTSPPLPYSDGPRRDSMYRSLLSDQPSGSQSSSKRSRKSDQKRRKIRKRNKLKAASPLNFSVRPKTHAPFIAGNRYQRKVLYIRSARKQAWFRRLLTAGSRGLYFFGLENFFVTSIGHENGF